MLPGVKLYPLALALAACSSSPASAVLDGGDAAAKADAPVDAGPCGVRSDRRGATTRKIQVDGVDRTYVVYLPQNDDPAKPVPLVFVHHGYTMSGQNMFDITGFPQLADSEHIALAFPDGQAGPSALGPPWNVGANVCPAYSGAPPIASGNDFAFLDAMKADIAQDQCLDAAHTFITGFSMGGYFTHQAACMRSDIRGAAPHSGGTHPLDQCTNAKMPIIIFHGDADPLIPAGCADPSAIAVPGHDASAAAWAAHNGCGTTTHSIDVDNGTCEVWDGCPAGGQVELCTFTAMGHCWAGGVTGSIYACSGYASATQLEWDFFKQYAW